MFLTVYPEVHLWAGGLSGERRWKPHAIEARVPRGFLEDVQQPQPLLRSPSLGQRLYVLTTLHAGRKEKRNPKRVRHLPTWTELLLCPVKRQRGL